MIKIADVKFTTTYKPWEQELFQNHSKRHCDILQLEQCLVSSVVEWDPPPIRGPCALSPVEWSNASPRNSHFQLFDESNHFHVLNAIPVKKENTKLCKGFKIIPASKYSENYWEARFKFETLWITAWYCHSFFFNLNFLNFITCIFFSQGLPTITKRKKKFLINNVFNFIFRMAMQIENSTWTVHPTVAPIQSKVNVTRMKTQKVQGEITTLENV